MVSHHNTHYVSWGIVAKKKAYEVTWRHKCPPQCLPCGGLLHKQKKKQSVPQRDDAWYYAIKFTWGDIL